MAPIADLIDRREQVAAGSLRRSRARLEQHRRTLGQLLRYRQEYLERLRSEPEAQRNALDIRNFRDFLYDLDLAVAQVRERLGAAVRVHAESKRVWLGKRAHARAVRKVLARRRAEAVRRETRREQLESDDRSATAARALEDATYRGRAGRDA